jgi:thioredoxin reductase
MYDVIIIGAGPAGLTAAQVLGRQGRNTVVVDGGRPRNAPSPELHMFPSRDGCAPAQLNRLARDELAAYPTVQLVDGEVIGVGGTIDDFDITLAGGDSHRGRRLILATGTVDELSHIDGIAERFGRGASAGPSSLRRDSTQAGAGEVASRSGSGTPGVPRG